MGNAATMIIILITGLIFFAKNLIHRDLDKKNGKLIKPLLGSHPLFIYYIFPYMGKVSEKTKRQKVICNLLWAICFILVVVLIVNKK